MGNAFHGNMEALNRTVRPTAPTPTAGATHQRVRVPTFEHVRTSLLDDQGLLNFLDSELAKNTPEPSAEPQEASAEHRESAASGNTSASQESAENASGAGAESDAEEQSEAEPEVEDSEAKAEAEVEDSEAKAEA